MGRRDGPLKNDLHSRRYEVQIVVTGEVCPPTPHPRTHAGCIPLHLPSLTLKSKIRPCSIFHYFLLGGARCGGSNQRTCGTMIASLSPQNRRRAASASRRSAPPPQTARHSWMLPSGFGGYQYHRCRRSGRRRQGQRAAVPRSSCALIRSDGSALPSALAAGSSGLAHAQRTPACMRTRKHTIVLDITAPQDRADG